MVQIGNITLTEFPLLLAPMEDVSDPPFRALCKENGADVVYTEFISSEGLIRDAAKSVQKLDIYEKERPVGIQIFGANLDSMLQSVDIVEKSKPDIIDINFGCPRNKRLGGRQQALKCELRKANDVVFHRIRCIDLFRILGGLWLFKIQKH